MKKLLAILIMCVCVANVTIAQNNHRRMMMKHHFENLDSASRSNWFKAQRDFWKKQMTQEEKKWKKQIAQNQPGTGSPMMAFQGFPKEQRAQFIGGKEALNNWIAENITFPMLADENENEGRVIVTFDVNVDGTIGNVQVEKSGYAILDSEVVSKMESMPRWIPARQNGRRVKTKYTLPISFIAVS
jgi:TonB family protein